jgi:hypothetical protein
VRPSITFDSVEGEYELESFPYVVVFGEVPPEAIERLATRLTAFDEVNMPTELLLYCRDLPRYGDKYTAEHESQISQLFGGRDPIDCRAWLIDGEVLHCREGLWQSWLAAGPAVRNYCWRMRGHHLLIEAAVWINHSGGFLKIGDEGHK